MPKIDNFQAEATQFCFDKGINVTPHQAEQIAVHFYNLGFYDGYKAGETGVYDE